MKLEGTLDIFPLRELIEMIIYSSVTGSLNIFGGQHEGRILFYDGRPYHAVYGDKTGMAAVIALFEETDAHFSFIDEHVEAEETIFSDPLDMIDHAERSAARWKQVRKYVKSMDVVPYLTCPVERARYSVSPEHWPIFTSIDGQHSVADIAHELNIEEIEVCEAIAQMRSDNLIELRRPQPRLVAYPADAPSAPPNPKSGVLDRLMARASTEAAPSPTSDNAAPAPSFPTSPQNAEEEDPILRLLRS